MGFLSNLSRRFLAEAVSPQGAYQTAGTGRRSRWWTPPTFGPNTALDYSAQKLRDQSRELLRKNTVAAAAIERLVGNIIGTGIKPQLPEAQQALWNAWTDESAADGMLDFYGQQAQATAAMITAGECFVRLRVRRIQDGMASVPLQLEILESEFCPMDKNAAPLGQTGEIRQGIEFHPAVRSRRVAYWLYPRHPGELGNGAFGNEPVRVPASEILHLYIPTRPGQIRGEPWMARVLDRLTDVEQYDKAELVRKKTSAMFLGFIRRLLPDALTLDELQEVWGDDAEAQGGQGTVSLEPGTMQVLGPGEDVTFADPKDVGGQYEVFMRQQLRAIASGMGLLYEQLSGDYSQVNDRTWRAAMNDFKRRVEMWQHNVIVFQFCRPVYARWALLGGIAGKVKADPAAIKWTPPRWPYINPLQDIEAIQAEVRAGLASRSQAVSERGDDAARIDAEQAEDNKRADELELIYDSDGRQSVGAGDQIKVADAAAQSQAEHAPPPPPAAKPRAELDPAALVALMTANAKPQAQAVVIPEKMLTVDVARPTVTEIESRDRHGRILTMLIKPASGDGPVLRRTAIHDADGRLTGHRDELVAKEFEEGKHPRAPKGSPDGGKWVDAPNHEDDKKKDDKNKYDGAADLYDAKAEPVTVEDLLKDLTAEERQKLVDARKRLDGITPTDALVSEGGHQTEKGLWSDERSKLHDKIVADHFTPEKIAAAKPKDGEKPVFTMLGGRGGSGKGTLQANGTISSKGITIDPDHIKGMLPEYKGWNAAQVHEESGYIANMIEHAARRMGLHTVFDATMSHPDRPNRQIKDFKEAGYEVRGHYVFASPKTAAKRALKRFFGGGANGRYVPLEYVVSSTKNERVFDGIRGELDEWNVYDNDSGTGPVKVASGGLVNG